VTYAAMLRAVNVAGRNPVAMADLREMLTELGFAGVQSLLQSGNLVFRSGSRPSAALERMLETEVAKRFDLRTDFFVRTGAELKTVVARNPFPQEAERDPGRLVVMFLKSTPSAAAVQALQAAIAGPEVVCPRGRHLYVTYPDGQGRSRLTNAAVEKRLDTRGTARNWNTLLRLVDATS
jgi:uncharacterized protein (DUF1697 family)